MSKRCYEVILRCSLVSIYIIVVNISCMDVERSIEGGNGNNRERDVEIINDNSQEPILSIIGQDSRYEWPGCKTGIPFADRIIHECAVDVIGEEYNQGMELYVAIYCKDRYLMESEREYCRYFRLLKDYSRGYRVLLGGKELKEVGNIKFFFASVLYDSGRYGSAMSYCREIIEKHPESRSRYNAILMLGDMYFRSCEYSLAMKEYKKIIDKYEQERVDGKRRTLRSEMVGDIEFEATIGPAMYKYTWCLIKTGEIDKAREAAKLLDRLDFFRDEELWTCVRCDMERFDDLIRHEH